MNYKIIRKEKKNKKNYTPEKENATHVRFCPSHYFLQTQSLHLGF